MPYYVYALYSEEFDKIYIGYTSDLELRLNSHNDERNTGWTHRYRPWKLIYHEEFGTKSESLRREK